MEYIYIKQAQAFNHKGLTSELSVEPKFEHIYHIAPQSLVVVTSSDLSSQELGAVDNIVNDHDPAPYDLEELLKKSVSGAMDFGKDLIIKFGAENMLLGIIQYGMLSTVRKNMKEVTDALTSGAITDAIAEARAIPAENKDAIFITDQRLLNYINLCEDYLGMERSVSL
jgi:hypothetical protein